MGKQGQLWKWNDARGWGGEVLCGQGGGAVSVCCETRTNHPMWANSHPSAVAKKKLTKTLGQKLGGGGHHIHQEYCKQCVNEILGEPSKQSQYSLLV